MSSKQTYRLNVFKSADVSDDDIEEIHQHPPTSIYYESDHEDTTSEEWENIKILLKQREKFTKFALLPLCTIILSGMIFGLCLNKGRVFEPHVILNQMNLTNFIMLKLFLSAAGSSAIMMALCSYLYPKHFAFARAKRRSVDNLLVITCGGFILGVGTTVAGSCPGMVLVQCGAGVPYSYVTLFGLLFGGFLCGIIKALLPIQQQPFCHVQYVFIDEYFTQHRCHYINYRVLCILFGVICWCVVIVFEVLHPWKSELTLPNDTNCNFLTCGAWPPYVCGIIIGMIQIPLISVLGNTLGCSSSYVCLMSQWLRYCNERTQNIFAHFKNEMDKWWQVIFVLSAIFGSWIAVALAEQPLNVSMHPYDNIEGLNSMRSLCGGVLLIFGSRIARGCTSGHGLSGFALLSISSLFVVGAMFGGAILTAYVIQHYF